ncbi:MAG: hypothetical protein IJ598_05300 [Ruminococcus sp.]|nr:hypothetical protein [Ruminococcus sp.]
MMKQKAVVTNQDIERAFDDGGTYFHNNSHTAFGYLSVKNPPQKLTNFTSNKKAFSPNTTTAATNCEGIPPLEIDQN